MSEPESPQLPRGIASFPLAEPLDRHPAEYGNGVMAPERLAQTVARIRWASITRP